MSKFCTNCGTKLEEDQLFCTSCGKKVDGENNDNAQQVAVNPVNNNVPNNSSVKTNGLAIAGFVVSLVSTILCCGAFNLVGLVLSIVGLTKAKDYDGNGKGFAIAGIIISAVVMVLSIVIYIFLFSAGVWTEVMDELFII